MALVSGRLNAWKFGLVAAAAAALAGCGTSPVSGPATDSSPLRHEIPAARHELVRVAGQMIGTPYRYGGDNRRGFDCSGLVQYAHRQIGVPVPRTTASQWRYARTPNRRQLLPGDLVFFEIDAKKNRHVGIYEGGGSFIHAPSSGKQVSRASLDNPFWQRRLLGAKTFL